MFSVAAMTMAMSGVLLSPRARRMEERMLYPAMMRMPEKQMRR